MKTAKELVQDELSSMGYVFDYSGTIVGSKPFNANTIVRLMENYLESHAVMVQDDVKAGLHYFREENMLGDDLSIQSRWAEGHNEHNYLIEFYKNREVTFTEHFIVTKGFNPPNGRLDIEIQAWARVSRKIMVRGFHKMFKL